MPIGSRKLYSIKIYNPNECLKSACVIQVFVYCLVELNVSAEVSCFVHRKQVCVLIRKHELRDPLAVRYFCSPDIRRTGQNCTDMRPRRYKANTLQAWRMWDAFFIITKKHVDTLRERLTLLALDNIYAFCKQVEMFINLQACSVCNFKIAQTCPSLVNELFALVKSLEKCFFSKGQIFFCHILFG